MEKYKQIIIFCVISMLVQDLFSQSNSQNYIVSTTFLDEAGTQNLDVINYYDGLGRETQTIYKNVTCTQGDLVTCKDYDGMGRVYREWMPLPFSNNNGNFIQSGAWTDRDIDEPYTKVIYEPSSLSRIIETWGVGLEWHKRKGIEKKYLFNDNSALLSAVCFRVENNRLKKTGKYKWHDLYVEYTNNEDGHEMYIFTDKLGNLVLERRVNGDEYIDTYYVYDEHDKLRFVLPPLAADELTSATDGFFEMKNDNVLGKYAYVYKYDSRNRCNYKKLPGCAEINMTYDIHGNLIFSDNGELRKKDLVEFYRYDKYNRIIMRGVISAPNFDWKTNSYQGTYEIYNGNSRCYGYSNSTGLDIATKDIHEVYYYDDYSFLNLFEEYIDSLTYKPREGYGMQYVDEQVAHLSSNGLQTGSLKKIIGDDNKLFINASYYDNKRRLVQSRTNNYMGGYDCYYYQYDYVGNVLRKIHSHNDPTNTVFGYEELYTYSYDAGKRLIECKHKLKSGKERLLCRNSYDEYGRVIEKSYTEKCKTTYDYNMRNQLTNIQFDDLYNQTYVLTNGGNIERTDWYCDNIDFRHTYTYTYDKLDRLVSAKHTANDEIASQIVDYQKYDGKPLYDVQYEYDKHGNITHLQRLGYTREYNVRSLDDLTYQYNGNQLMSIEATENAQYINNFEDEVHDAEECFYDLNGNLVRDNNRNLQNIDYNYLNLPQQIYYGKQDAGKVIFYTYATDGTKLRALYATGTNNILSPIGVLNTNVDNDIIYSDSTVYCDNSIYVNGKLDKILLPDGYVQVTYRTIRGRLVAFYDYYYTIKDHQGSARINIAEEYLDNRPSEGCRKALSYYPFGKAMNNWISWVVPFKDPYTYTGKKEETMHGLGWYDYGKRFYDPNYRLSFVSVDPLCEKYYSISPYAYCANNPINAIDLNGDSIWYTIDKDVVTMHVTGKIIDSSSDGINVNRAASDIASGISDVFSGVFKFEGQTYTLQTDVQLDVVSSMDDVMDSDHLFVLRDADGQSARGAVNMLGGKVLNLASSDYTNDNWFSNTFFSNNIQTALHEFGHTAGLIHTDPRSNNLMEPGGSRTNITSEQRATMMNMRSRINGGSNYLMRYKREPYPYVHDSEAGVVYTATSLLNWNTKYRRR